MMFMVLVLILVLWIFEYVRSVVAGPCVRPRALPGFFPLPISPKTNIASYCFTVSAIISFLTVAVCVVGGKGHGWREANGQALF